MKSLDRTLIEKAGYDNDFEITENSLEKLGSSQS